MVLVRDLMITNPNTVHPDAPLSQVLQLMRDVSCRHVPVLENGILVGIISERDLRLAVEVPVFDFDDVHNHQVRNMAAGEIMTSKPITAELDTSVQQAAKWLNSNDISALPVVENGVLIGIVTVYDILSYVAGLPELVAT